MIEIRLALTDEAHMNRIYQISKNTEQIARLAKAAYDKYSYKTKSLLCEIRNDSSTDSQIKCITLPVFPPSWTEHYHVLVEATHIENEWVEVPKGSFHHFAFRPEIEILIFSTKIFLFDQMKSPKKLWLPTEWYMSLEVQ